MSIKSYRDLRVWQAGMDLVEEIYLRTRQFPPEEKHGLVNQMRRAAVSVPSNIAEGHTREHLKEYLHHLSMAQASLAELQTQVDISCRLAFLPLNEAEEVTNHITSASRQLYALRNSLRG